MIGISMLKFVQIYNKALRTANFIHKFMVYWESARGGRVWKLPGMERYRGTEGHKRHKEFLMIVKVRVLVIQKYRNDKNNRVDFYFAGIVMRVV